MLRWVAVDKESEGAYLKLKVRVVKSQVFKVGAYGTNPSFPAMDVARKEKGAGRNFQK